MISFKNSHLYKKTECLIADEMFQLLSLPSAAISKERQNNLGVDFVAAVRAGLGFGVANEPEL